MIQTKTLGLAAVLLQVRPIRRFWHFIERTIPFLRVAFSDLGLGSREGRILIWGKFRRVVLSSVPPLAKHLQKHYGVKGGCEGCGSSCNLLFQCPHWEEQTGLCSVYEDRPNICRLFPITPADIRDRNLVAKNLQTCGFSFAPQKGGQPRKLIPAVNPGLRSRD